jgi:hypothetical protein
LSPRIYCVEDDFNAVILIARKSWQSSLTQCPVVAQSGGPNRADACPLAGVKRS